VKFSGFGSVKIVIITVKSYMRYPSKIHIRIYDIMLTNIKRLRRILYILRLKKNYYKYVCFLTNSVKIHPKNSNKIIYFVIRNIHRNTASL